MSVINRVLNTLSKYLPRSCTPLLLFFFGVCVTLETSYFLVSILDDKEKVLFDNSVTRTENIITDYVGMYGVMLRSVKGLFVVQSTVPKEDFRAFVQELRLRERYPGILGLGYVRSFSDQERPEVSAKLSALGVTNWQVFPEGTRADYNTIVFLEPSDDLTKKAIGFDLSYESISRAAMEKARDTGSLTMSANVVLVQDSNATAPKGFSMFLPLYQPSKAPTTLKERRQNLVGYVYAPFLSEDFFKAIFNSDKTLSMVDVEVYNGQFTRTDKLLYSSRADSDYKPVHSTTRQIEVAGNSWTVVYTNKPEFEAFARREVVLFLLAGGLLSSMLLFIVSKKQSDARARAEESEELLLASQEELQSSEERFRLLVESAQDYAIMHLDLYGRINSWNVGAEKMFGYREDEILNQHFSIFFTSEDTKAGVPERELQRVLTYGHTEDENWAVRKDGSYFWASGSSTAIYDENGALRGLAKIARDLSLRKKTEEILRKNDALTQAVLQSLPSFIAVLDQKGKIIAINESVSEEGSLRAEFFKEVQVRKNYLELMKQYTAIDIAIRRKIITGTQAVLDERQLTFKFEFPITQEKAENWLLVQVTPLKYSGSGVVVSHTDITERKNLEKQKDEFISIASHELKTPITSIKAYIQVLHKFLRHLENEQFLNIIGRVDTQVSKLASLVNDLLDVSKVESGQLRFNYEVFDFGTLVDETVESMQFTTQTHSLKKQGKSNIQVYADRERVAQVMVNLLSNAIKYSPAADEVLVTTSVIMQEKKKLVQFCVTDFGVGIPHHQQKRVFDRFYRANASAAFSGLGLGLYISAQIIKRLGGKIWVESSKGKGARFCFTLPL